MSANPRDWLPLPPRGTRAPGVVSISARSSIRSSELRIVIPAEVLKAAGLALFDRVRPRLSPDGRMLALERSIHGTHRICNDRGKNTGYVFIGAGRLRLGVTRHPVEPVRHGASGRGVLLIELPAWVAGPVAALSTCETCALRDPQLGEKG